MKQYLMRTYDLYWNDVIRKTVINAIDDDTAINIAKTSFELLVSPSAMLELQVCCKGMSLGTWDMFAAVYYDDDGTVIVDDCFC